MSDSSENHTAQSGTAEVTAESPLNVVGGHYIHLAEDGSTSYSDGASEGSSASVADGVSTTSEVSDRIFCTWTQLRLFHVVQRVYVSSMVYTLCRDIVPWLPYFSLIVARAGKYVILQ